MREIQLNKRRASKHKDAPMAALVDDETFGSLNALSWYAVKDRRTFYVVHKPNKRARLTYMHHLVLGCTPNRQVQVDHRNGLGWDNQGHNLRRSTPSQNGANKRRNTNNRSGYKGVSFSNSHKMWIAQICVNYEHIWLGDYPTKELAAAAHDAAAIKYFGEFAKVNFPIQAKVDDIDGESK